MRSFFDAPQSRLSLTLTAACLTFTACTSVGPSADPLLVKTEAGQVRGAAQVSAATTAEVFLGIPFAAAPVGPLRWAAPARPLPWQGVRDGTVMPPYCPQGQAQNFKGVEDCLQLNIYRPAGTHPGASLPVMVYAPGGGNVVGGAADFDGTRMATDNDIIVVVPNYRLGALGFLNHPALAPTDRGGNFGVLDTKAALEWVQRNISAFGGRPGKVTLASQSSGSTNTCRLLVDPATAGLFHAATLLSVGRDPGATAFIFTTPPQANPTTFTGLPFALNFNVDTDAPKIFATSGLYTESAMSFMAPPNPANLSKLRDRGAKIIAYHGTSDAIFSFNDTVSWFQGLMAANNGDASRFARLYPVTGMNHCSGGMAVDQFDLLDPLVNWVEKGAAPASVTAAARGTGTSAVAALVNAEVPATWSPGRTRPLCPWPTVARYNGSGSTEVAANFSCKS